MTIKSLWAPWRASYVTDPAKDGGECFLCDAAHPHVINATDDTLTVINRFPYNPGHLLIAPRRHFAHLTEASPTEGLSLIQAVQQALTIISTVLAPDGFNIGINEGNVAGSSIDHLHFHVVPRWSGDTNFMPVLSDVKVIPEHLEVTATKLRTAFHHQQSP